jgi:predicted DNA-binding antitoxin AbrB/MazE fold protein
MRPVEASYENGQLVPVHPLPLRPGERVGIVFVRRPDRARWDFDRLSACGAEDEALARAGLDEWARALTAEDHH